MSRSADHRPRPGWRSVARLAGGSAAAGTLLLAVPGLAFALPAGATAPVLDMSGPVVEFYAGTAEVDGSTTIEPTTTGTRSRLDCTILFAKDSDVLRPGAKDRLRRLADQLHTQGAGRVAITGYTDDLGSAAHGLDLSARRARRVAAELRRVLPAKRFPMTLRGLGEAHPAVPNTSEANRRKNRRVVVTLTRTAAPTAAEQPAPPPRMPAPTPSPTAVAPSTVVTTVSPTAISPASTPAAAPPPPAPDPPASPVRADSVPWRWIVGVGAALVALGAMADAWRRRRGRTASRTQAPGPETTAAARPDSIQPEGPTTLDTARSTPVPVPPGPEASPPSPAAPGGQPTGAARAGADVVAAGSPPTSALEAALAADVAAWRSADTYRPRLSVLGPVHARTRGQALARRRPFYTELLAYLVLRPRGATVEEIGDDFGLTPARVRTDMKILRDWLGADPRTGRPYLPDARTTPAAVRRGVAVYQLEGVLCDWSLFERVRAAAAKRPEGDRVADLRSALDLVAGRPFDQARPAGWGWLFEGDRIDLHVAKTVTDVAVELIEYHLHRDDDRAASEVVQVLVKMEADEAIEMAGVTRA